MGGVKFEGGPKTLGGVGTMNRNDTMVVVLKDIPLCLLGFRFIYIVYISWYYIMSYISKVLLPPTCLNFGLPVSPVCLSVSQTSDVSGHKGNTGQLLNSRVLGVL